MDKNIEIKAIIQDSEHIVSKIEEFYHQSSTNQTKIEQHDTFFKAKDGRLKLRKFKVGVIINFLIITHFQQIKIYIFWYLEHMKRWVTYIL